MDQCDADYGNDSVTVPGRVNLIGEHIDYHALPVLPMALGRAVRVTFQGRSDRGIHLTSAGYGRCKFEWTAKLECAAPGNWENYARAAAQTVGGKWGVGVGIDASIESDLPAAAGLSSSSAVLVGVALALMRANRIAPSFEELMEILPEGEQFVGTRGGGMDHAAVLGSRTGCASLIGFEPLSLWHIGIPPDWAFLVAHSLQSAEKSGGQREEFNARRTAGTAARERLGFGSYSEVLKALAGADPATMSGRLNDGMERDSFLHVTSEALRVNEAAGALDSGAAERFGQLLVASHASLRDRLRVSCAALDRLVDAAMESGALGARLTGGGFGGCAVVFCRRADLAKVERGLEERFYRGRCGFDRRRHLIRAEPSDGALGNATASA
jgi:galactokinase